MNWTGFDTISSNNKKTAWDSTQAETNMTRC